MGLTNAEHQRLWRARHATKARQHTQQLSQVYGQGGLKGKPLKKTTDASNYSSKKQHEPAPMRPELQIERTLRTRRNSNDETETLVKFKGWPAKYNRWLTDDEVLQYQ
jgi:hypothetical protein